MVVVQKATVYKQGLLNISVKNNGKHHKIAKNHTQQTKTGQNTNMQNVGLGRFPSPDNNDNNNNNNNNDNNNIIIKIIETTTGRTATTNKLDFASPNSRPSQLPTTSQVHSSSFEASCNLQLK